MVTVHGSRGETVTIAEKRSWVPIGLASSFDRGTPGRIRMLVRPDAPLARLVHAQEYAFTLCYHEDERITDTDGPAGCLTLGPPGTDGLTDFLFFGWATTPACALPRRMPASQCPCIIFSVSSMI